MDNQTLPPEQNAPAVVKFNRCDACGCFISYEDLLEGYAVRRLVYPDSHFTREEYETLCARHK